MNEHRIRDKALAIMGAYTYEDAPVTLPDCKKRFPFQFGHKHWAGTPGKARAIVHPAIETKGLTKDDIPALKEQTHQFFQNQLRKEGYS